jgi:hypothetical protein
MQAHLNDLVQYCRNSTWQKRNESKSSSLLVQCWAVSLLSLSTGNRPINSLLFFVCVLCCVLRRSIEVMFPYPPKNVSFVRLFICFLGVTTHSGSIFRSPVAGFSLLVFEVSLSHTTMRHSR